MTTIIERLAADSGQMFIRFFDDYQQAGPLPDLSG
jgi:hypothetical protein